MTNRIFRAAGAGLIVFALAGTTFTLSAAEAEKPEGAKVEKLTAKSDKSANFEVWCKENPAKCEKKKQRMEARKAQCEANPERCKRREEKKARREEGMSSQGQTVPTPQN